MTDSSSRGPEEQVTSDPAPSLSEFPSPAPLRPPYYNVNEAFTDFACTAVPTCMCMFDNELCETRVIIAIKNITQYTIYNKKLLKNTFILAL